MHLRALCVVAALLLASVPAVGPALAGSAAQSDAKWRVSVWLPDFLSESTRFQGSVTVTALTADRTPPSAMIVRVPAQAVSTATPLGASAPCEQLADDGWRCATPTLANRSGTWWGTVWIRGYANRSDPFTMSAQFEGGPTASVSVPQTVTADLRVVPPSDPLDPAPTRYGLPLHSILPYAVGNYRIQNDGPGAMRAQTFVMVYEGTPGHPTVPTTEYGRAQIWTDSNSCSERTTRWATRVFACEVDLPVGHSVHVTFNASIPKEDTPYTLVPMVWPASDPIPGFDHHFVIAALPARERVPSDNLGIINASWDAASPAPHVELSYGAAGILGEIADLHVFYGNRGGPAGGAILRVEAEGATALHPDSDAYPDWRNCTYEGTTALCPLEQLPAQSGGIARFRFTLGEKDILLRATLETGPERFGPDGALAPYTVVATRSVQVGPQKTPQLSVSLEGATTARGGVAETYTVTLRNNGMGDQRNPVNVTLTMPLARSYELSEGCVRGVSGPICTVGSLDAGASHTWQVRVFLSANATLVASAPDVPQAELGVTVLPAVADLVLQTLELSQRRARVGDPINVTISVRNDGPSRVGGVYVVARLPEGLTFADTSRGPCVKSGGEVRCSMGTMDAGAVVTHKIPITASRADNYEGQANVAMPFLVGSDPNGANDLRTFSIAVAPAL